MQYIWHYVCSGIELVTGDCIFLPWYCLLMCCERSPYLCEVSDFGTSNIENPCNRSGSGSG